jgi:hypothetical protein
VGGFKEWVDGWAQGCVDGWMGEGWVGGGMGGWVGGERGQGGSAGLALL